MITRFISRYAGPILAFLIAGSVGFALVAAYLLANP